MISPNQIKKYEQLTDRMAINGKIVKKVYSNGRLVYPSHPPGTAYTAYSPKKGCFYPVWMNVASNADSGIAVPSGASNQAWDYSNWYGYSSVLGVGGGQYSFPKAGVHVDGMVTVHTEWGNSTPFLIFLVGNDYINCTRYSEKPYTITNRERNIMRSMTRRSMLGDSYTVFSEKEVLSMVHGKEMTTARIVSYGSNTNYGASVSTMIVASDVPMIFGKWRIRESGHSAIWITNSMFPARAMAYFPGSFNVNQPAFFFSVRSGVTAVKLVYPNTKVYDNADLTYEQEQGSAGNMYDTNADLIPYSAAKSYWNNNNTSNAARLLRYAFENHINPAKPFDDDWRKDDEEAI